MLGKGFCPILSAGKEDTSEFVECINHACEWWGGDQCILSSIYYGINTAINQITMAIEASDTSIDLTSILTEVEDINRKLGDEE